MTSASDREKAKATALDIWERNVDDDKFDLIGTIESAILSAVEEARAEVYDECAKSATASYPHGKGCELYTVGACTCDVGEAAAILAEEFRQNAARARSQEEK